MKKTSTIDPRCSPPSGASPAIAADTALTLWNSTGNPSGAVVTAIGTSTAVLSGSSLGGITISTSGVQRETVPNNGMTESNLFITNTTGTVQTLDILAGTNSFLGPNNLFDASATVLIASGQADLTGQFFVDPLNTLNGVNTGPVVGTQIGSTFDERFCCRVPFSFSANSPFVPFSVTGLYGMAESLQLTLQPGAFVGVQSISMDATNAVPEPSTWAMGIAGFGLLALRGLRKRRVSRCVVKHPPHGQRFGGAPDGSPPTSIKGRAMSYEISWGSIYTVMAFVGFAAIVTAWVYLS